MVNEQRGFHRCGYASLHARRDTNSFVFPDTSPKFERSRPFILHHLALDLTLDVRRKSIAATATLHLTRVDPEATHVCIDAVGYLIETVSEAGTTSPFDYRYDGETLTVPIPPQTQAIALEIRYHCAPKRGLYFLAPDEHVPHRPHQVWSQCQDEDARYWVPCLDKPHMKQTTELRVTAPKGWYALSNGTLVEHRSTDENEWFHWRMQHPHSTYLLTLVAGVFSELDGGLVDAIPLRYFVPPGREEDGRRCFQATPEMMRHFGDLTGVPFPWEKYSQIVVSDFTFGGMENTTATTLYEHVLLDEKASLDHTSDDLIAHELAHHWFGDYVTCRDWHHGWLNEGFATYFEHLDREHRLGIAEYEYGLLRDQESYFSETRERYLRPLVCRQYDAPIDLFDRHLYEKGSLVLHLLRQELGNTLFWKGVQEYLKRHRFGTVETIDLQRALEDASGRSLDRFFDQWVYRAGHPDLVVQIVPEPHHLRIHVRQTPLTTVDSAPFWLPFELDVAQQNGTVQRHLFTIERAHETFVVPTAEEVLYVVVDPRHRILGPVRREIPSGMLRAQLTHAPSARGRWLAAQSLEASDEEQTYEVFHQTLWNQHEFWGVQSEVAKALGALRSEKARQLLEQAARVPHPKVRRSVAIALGRFRHPAAAHALRDLAMSDPSYAVQASAAKALGTTRQAAAFTALVELLDQPSWGDLVRTGALDGLGALRDEKALSLVWKHCAYGHSSRVRQAAVHAVAQLTDSRLDCEKLEELLDDNDAHLRSQVVQALVVLGRASSRSALARTAERDDDGQVRRRAREALRELDNTLPHRHQHLTDELEKLHNEFAELRSRLCTLEATPPLDEKKSGIIPS